MLEKQWTKKTINSIIFENKKFLIIFASLNSEIYEAIQITYKPDDQKYLIHAIDGVLYFRNNIKGCRKKMKEIVKRDRSSFN